MWLPLNTFHFPCIRVSNPVLCRAGSPSGLWASMTTVSREINVMETHRAPISSTSQKHYPACLFFFFFFSLNKLLVIIWLVIMLLWEAIWQTITKNDMKNHSLHFLTSAYKSPFRLSYLFWVHSVCKTRHAKGEAFISHHFIFEVLIRGPKNANTFGNSPQSHNEQIYINLSILPVSRVWVVFTKSSFLPHPCCKLWTMSK